MRLLETLQSALILAAIVVGLVVGRWPGVSAHASYVIVPLLMVMLCGGFLQIPLRDVRVAFRQYHVTGVSLAMNFLWTPIFAWGLGAMFLADAPELWVGFLMLMVTPCTDWYLVFTGLARGNVALGTALLPWNLILQMVLLPAYLLLLAGTLVSIQVPVLMESIVLVLLVPMGVACVARRGVERTKGRPWLHAWLLPKVMIAQLGLLLLAIMAMFASQGTLLLDQPQRFLKLFPPVVLFFAGNFLLGHVVGRVLRLPYTNLVTLCCTTLARNAPIAFAIAVMAFPERPLIALALVIGPLIELPVLGIVAHALLVEQRQGWWTKPRPIEERP